MFKLMDRDASLASVVNRLLVNRFVSSNSSRTNSIEIPASQSRPHHLLPENLRSDSTGEEIRLASQSDEMVQI